MSSTGQKDFYRDLRVGILGGGQLGRMFLHACHRFNVSADVLDPDALAPAGPLASRFVQGSFKDADTVYQFGMGVDVLTIEIEHVSTAPLHQLVAEGVQVYPRPETIELVQDKGLQKAFYLAQGIPTSPFRLVDDPKLLTAQDIATPKALKLRKGGYDGQGVMMLRTEADLAGVFAAPCVLEDAVPIDKEIAVLLARSPRGQLIAYPPVEMAFHPTANLVEYLFSPAALTIRQVQDAQRLAVQVAEALDLVGLLAVEMFLTPEGELLVNEIAPRPHNSGHHTLEANMTSQFEQHLRAILNLPLGSTALKTPAVMVNILGAADASGEPVYEGMEDVLQIPGVSLHLYGKHQVRPFRKMGHLTVCDTDLARAQDKARRIQTMLRVTAR
jgi:5-(carboxyamino)imidazole ribonucleotide synthase